MSEYIANLNAIPSASDLPNEDEFSLDADLAMFTNTQFFDYDLGTDTDLQPTNQGVDGQDGRTVAPDNVDLNSLEFMNGKPIRGSYYSLCSCSLVTWDGTFVLVAAITRRCWLE